ncbi:MAG: LysM peptidoglycan-binding domain-containing protein [Gammaproteobacteria bacterium]|nr:LysM peptidoglycan-binding domain-containing protein [Gammaproteobacteria bacterium]
MANNKLFDTNFTRFLPALLAASLLACAQPQEKQDVIPVMAEPEPEIVVREPAEPVKVQRDYPERYVVKKGDTLWDIAKTFLKDPWLWPSVWHINPEIRNPHLIYPGDVLALYFDENGKPYITLEGTGGYVPPSKAGKTVKVSPSVRYKTLDKAINTIPRSVIAPFLGAPRIISEQELEKLPYIVSSFEQHLISGTGNTIYAKNIVDETIGAYDIIRPKGEYRDPKTQELLGYEVTRLADARVVRFGKPVSTLSITKAFQEVFNKDLLMAKEEYRFNFNFFPHPPIEDVTGQIIDVFNGVAQIGQFNIVVLNVGEREGIEPGHVLAIYQKGERVRDPDAIFSWSKIDLPDERAGVLMVFKTYEKLSYGLVMEAQRALHVNDRVTNP